jgi:hypothetical protein
MVQIRRFRSGILRDNEVPYLSNRGNHTPHALGIMPGVREHNNSIASSPHPTFFHLHSCLCTAGRNYPERVGTPFCGDSSRFPRGEPGTFFPSSFKFLVSSLDFLGPVPNAEVHAMQIRRMRRQSPAETRKPLVHVPGEYRSHSYTCVFYLRSYKRPVQNRNRIINISRLTPPMG